MWLRPNQMWTAPAPYSLFWDTCCARWRPLVVKNHSLPLEVKSDFPVGFAVNESLGFYQRQSSAVKVRDHRCRCVIHADAKPPPKRQLQSIFHFHFTVSALNWVRKKFPAGANVKLKFWNNSLHRCLIEHIWNGNFTASLTTRFDQVTPSKCSLFVCFSSKLIPALRFAHILYLNSASAAWARSVFPAVVFLWGVSF